MMGFSALSEHTSARFGISTGASGAHAGENETSMMIALEPGLVQRDRFAAGYVGQLGEQQVQIIFARGMTALTANGVLGDPAAATADKGQAYLELFAEALAQKVAGAPAEAAAAPA